MSESLSEINKSMQRCLKSTPGLSDDQLRQLEKEIQKFSNKQSGHNITNNYIITNYNTGPKWTTCSGTSSCNIIIVKECNVHNACNFTSRPFFAGRK